MKRVLLGALALLSVTPALAQDEVAPNNLGVRLGLVFPTGRAARDISRTWFGVGVDYKIRTVVVNERGYVGELGASVDYYGREDFSVVPILATYKGRFAANNRFYYIGGLGLAITRTLSSNDSDTKARFAYTLGVGAEVTPGRNPIYVEGRFWGNGESDVNAFAIYAGIRF